MKTEMDENKELKLSYELYDKKPISWLIRWLEEKQKEGNDYVEFKVFPDYGGDDYGIKVSEV